MAGLLDFLFQGGQGGGLLGMGQPQPMNIGSPVQQQQGLLGGMGQAQLRGPSGNPYPGGMDPSLFAIQALQNQPQQMGGLMGMLSGTSPMTAIQNSLGDMADPEGKQRQQAIQNFIHLKQLGIQEKAAEEKPQYQQIEDPVTGLKRLVLIQPFGKGVSYVNPNEPGQAAGGAPPQSPLTLPPGADVHTARVQTAKDAVANQQEAVKSAKAAADIQPLLDEMHTAYEEAHKLGATGPISASTPGRYFATGASALGDATGLGSQSKPLEAARQRYDIAKAAVQARITAAQNKGEGQVSNYERQLYAAQFPDLTAIEPETQIKNLRQIRDQNRQTIEAGKIPTLGQAPQVGAVLNRPAVDPSGAPVAPPGPQPQPMPAAPAAPPVRVTSIAQANALPPGTRFIDPNGIPRTVPQRAPASSMPSGTGGLY